MKKSWIKLIVQFVQVLILIPAFSFAHTSSTSNTVTIVIEPVFNGQPLQLSSHYYVTEHGDSVYIDLFRFYITNLKLVAPAATVADTNSHLIDAEEIGTYTFQVTNVPSGNYSSLQFVVGVDSIANTSGANSGDLDPVKGMYWAWNSGYIMAKVEGRSAVCKTLHHVFEFHIGGYMPPYNTARTVIIPLPDHFTISGNGPAVIKIKADIAAWFKGNVDLSKTNDIVIPGKDAARMADRYAGMFSYSNDQSTSNNR